MGGIYLLNLFIGFLSPSIDPEMEGPGLPSSAKEGAEFRPFERRVPEFKFWPILLLYFIVLFFLTMKRQIKHMWKYKYVPWSYGKKKFKGKEPVTTSADSNIKFSSHKAT